MGKREKKLKPEDSSAEEGRRRKRKTTQIEDDDDDAEANADLSLKIVQKAMKRAVAADNGYSRSNGVSEMVMNLKEEKKIKMKKKRVKNKEIGVSEDPVDDVKDKEEHDTYKATESSAKADETNPVDATDNAVLRKLLRGPRYFDPPDNSWGACYNCGEEGHTTVNCTSAKRKKPCFVCGSFEHNARQCDKGRDCFICKQKGHRAKDCPEKNKISKMCLKCGDFGHEMFSCRNDYCPDDLKEMQCYICGRFGHLCCVNYSDPGPREDSCYRCGLSGHTGLACLGTRGETTSHTYEAGPGNSCYRCGLEGHFARECTTVKAGKRNRDPSTPKQQRSSKKNRDYREVRSAPHDLGKVPKKKKPQYGEYTPAPKTKHRGGWITEDTEDYHYNSKSKSNYWNTPANTSDRRFRNPPSPYGDYASSSYSSQKHRRLDFHDSPSNGSARFYQQKYSASRFSNNSNGGMGRNYNW